MDFADEARKRARKVCDQLIFRRLEKLPRQIFIARRAVLGFVDDDASDARFDRAAHLNPEGACSVVQGIQPVIELLRPIA